VNKPTRLDVFLGFIILAIGVAMVSTAVRFNPNSLNLYAGLDGMVTATVLGVALALAHPLPPRLAYALIAPVVLAELIALDRIGVASLAPVGIEALLIGAIGLAFPPLRSAVLDRQWGTEASKQAAAKQA
jgi:hypothetical protein